MTSLIIFFLYIFLECAHPKEKVGFACTRAIQAQHAYIRGLSKLSTCIYVTILRKTCVHLFKVFKKYLKKGLPSNFLPATGCIPIGERENMRI
jgi:hypothetical protein